LGCASTIARRFGRFSGNASGGFLERPNEEFLIRGRARVYSTEDLANSVVTVREGAPIRLKNIAAVQEGPALKRGYGSFNMQSAVVATIQKTTKRKHARADATDRADANPSAAKRFLINI